MAEREHFTNARCLAFATGLSVVGIVFGAQVSGWSHLITVGAGYAAGAILMASATTQIVKSFLSRETDPVPAQTGGRVVGMPTLSTLLGQNPTIDFNAKQFFALSYYSPITAEFEQNFRTIAQQQFPNDKEGFYTRFIGVGLAAFHYELTWYVIFKSQLLALEEMNSRGLIPIADVKKHYDKAVLDFPKTYTNYSFDQWVAYMKGRMLIVVHPSQMVELSWLGKDFLKYLAHTARDPQKQTN